jgi:hypothetical protein
MAQEVRIHGFTQPFAQDCSDQSDLAVSISRLASLNPAAAQVHICRFHFPSRFVGETIKLQSAKNAPDPVRVPELIIVKETRLSNTS